MPKYEVTRQYNINEIVEVEAENYKEAIELARADVGKIIVEAEFRDWLDPSNWPVYNPETNVQEN
jgi:hypothetical protein